MAEQYEKKELRQHIYDTPDTYVGGIDKINEVLPILNDNKIVFKEIDHVSGLISNSIVEGNWKFKNKYGELCD